MQGREAGKSRTVVGSGSGFPGDIGQREEEGREIRGKVAWPRPLSFVSAPWWQCGLMKRKRSAKVEPQKLPASLGREVGGSLSSAPLQGVRRVRRRGEAKKKHCELERIGDSNARFWRAEAHRFERKWQELRVSELPDRGVSSNPAISELGALPDRRFSVWTLHQEDNWNSRHYGDYRVFISYDPRVMANSRCV